MVHHMISVLPLWMRKSASVAVALLCLAGLAAGGVPGRGIQIGGKLVAIENPITATVTWRHDRRRRFAMVAFTSNISLTHWSLVHTDCTFPPQP